MGEEVLARAFEPFFTTKEVGKGSGLGLSQVYGFARQSGGHASIESELGTGTCATLWLPAVNETGEPASGEEVAQEMRSPIVGAVVLVVEDDLDVLQIVTASLSSARYRVQAARTGCEALAILERSNNVRFLLTDVALRGSPSGVELARAARALRRDLPIALTTGHAAAVLVAHGVVEGEFHLFRKPFRSGDLLAYIGAAVGWHDTARLKDV
jgi:CheY-like chemotaxis protein